MRPLLALCIALCLGVSAAATALTLERTARNGTPVTLKGTARNGTTGKPAAGDEVVLMSLARGLTVIGRSKTDAGGHFSFPLAGTPERRLVRVLHQGVAYDKIALPGVNAVEVQVYDVATELSGVTATGVHRFQAEGETLEAIEEIAVQNASNPPRTLMNGRPLQIQLPPEAEVLTGKVQLGGGRPLTGKPSPGDRKGLYYFPLPLYPGDTRFAVAYLLPYRGEAVIEPTILYPLKQFRVELPNSMQFEATTPGMFQPMPGRSGTNVQVAAAVTPGQSLAFRLSGMGTRAQVEDVRQQAQGGRAARPGAQATTQAGLPGGPHEMRWFFLGGFALVVAAGVAGFLKHKRKQPPRCV